MDYQVKWSLEATEDLESIAEYIARDSEFYARSVVSKILAVSRLIPEQPMIGRIVPEIGKKETWLYINHRLIKKQGFVGGTSVRYIGNLCQQLRTEVRPTVFNLWLVNSHKKK